MRWVAGIHRNIGNPHMHLQLNKNAVALATRDLARLPRLPAPLVAHYTKEADGRREFSYGRLEASEQRRITYGQQVAGGRTVHDLRHTCLTHLLQEGTDLATVRDFAGHHSIQETTKYVHPTAAGRRRAATASSSLVALARQATRASRPFRPLSACGALHSPNLDRISTLTKESSDSLRVSIFFPYKKA